MTTYRNPATGGSFTITTDDPDSSAGATTSPPDFADDASFGGSGDDYVTTDLDGSPLLANTGNARDWLSDTLAGRSSVDEEDFGGTFFTPTQNGEDVDIPLRDTGSTGGSGSTISGTGPEQTSISTDQINQALSRLASARASPSPATSSNSNLGMVAAVVGIGALVVGALSSKGD